MSDPAYLFAAFIAGFEASAEGYNGEIRPYRYTAEGWYVDAYLTDELAEAFEKWRAKLRPDEVEPH